MNARRRYLDGISDRGRLYIFHVKGGGNNEGSKRRIWRQGLLSRKTVVYISSVQASYATCFTGKKGSRGGR